MNLKNLAFLSVLVFVFSSCAEAEYGFFSDNTKVRLGFEEEWLSKEYNDDNWGGDADEIKPDTFTVRVTFDFSEVIHKINQKGLLVIGTGANEVYWDGYLIGRNGVLAGTNTAEVEGKYHRHFLLPDSLCAVGKHVLALKSTVTNLDMGHHNYAVVDEYANMLRSPLQISKYMFMLIGAFLLAAIYFFMTFFGRPSEISTLIFGVICLIFSGIVLMEYIKLFYEYPYSFQRTRLELIGFGHLMLTILIPIFLLKEFTFPYPKILLGILFCIIVFTEYQLHYAFDWIARFHNKTMFCFSIVIIIYAVIKRQKSAIPMLAGFIAAFALVWIGPRFRVPYVSSFDVTGFIAFMLIVLPMLYVMAIRRKEERLAYEASLVLSERLKNQLLRKNIKPHFIMNTLTSLMDWVEESPKEGVKFIGALASEFETLNTIADHKLVPIEQEIRLCQNHLEVMGYRKEINYKWQQKGIDLNEIIPPAIIHTAVENGVTHSLPNENGEVVFQLTFEKDKTSKRYTLNTFALNREESNLGKISKGGTGLKYIKSRLEESFPGKWKLSSKATNTGWETRIEIFS